ITIIGTGLIGGSLGLSLEAAGYPAKIVGCDRQVVLDRAKAMRAIDLGMEDPVEAIQGSDLIVLATPVGGIIDLIDRIGPLAPQTALITDVGSTKKEILERARSVFGDRAPLRYLGGHPMAGKEHSGLENAESKLFLNAAWLLTPYPDQRLEQGNIREFCLLLERIGARPIRLDPAPHARLCAGSSPRPKMFPTAMAATLADESGGTLDLLSTGARALRERTRLSSSPYSMWRDIAHTNSTNIAQSLMKLEQRL